MQQMTVSDAARIDPRAGATGFMRLSATQFELVTGQCADFSRPAESGPGNDPIAAVYMQRPGGGRVDRREVWYNQNQFLRQFGAGGGAPDPNQLVVFLVEAPAP